MKYLKTFEYNQESIYWMLPVYDYDLFKKSLDEIDIDPYDKSMFRSMLYHNEFRDNRYIYLGYDSNHIGWSFFPISSDYYDRRGFKYMGKINISDEELNQNKYNL